MARTESELREVSAYCIDSAAIEAEWKRVRGSTAAFELANAVRLERVQLAPVGERDVRVRVLAVSAEHNVIHAALADPVDIAKAHGGRHRPGNSFIGEVVEVGAAVDRLAIGEVVIPCENSRFDSLGFPDRTWGFDDGLPGCYADEVVLPAAMLMRAPLDCGLGFWELAVLPLRAANANHLWRRARDIVRAKIPRSRLPNLNVLAFGGGVSELFLMLAHSEGHRAVYCAGNAARRAHMDALGIRTLDQHEFNRFADERDVRRFRRAVLALTDGAGIHVVCDMFRGRLFDAGIAVMCRGGVNVSAGWQLQTAVQYDSALLSLRQITLDHAHVEMEGAGESAVSLFGSVFRPPMHGEIYAFADLPRALQELQNGVQTGFAAIRVADEMPAAVQALIAAGA